MYSICVYVEKIVLAIREQIFAILYGIYDCIIQANDSFVLQKLITPK